LSVRNFDRFAKELSTAVEAGGSERSAISPPIRNSSAARIGFVHQFRPLGAPEVRQLLEQHWV
jgi:hypothetical protein